MDVGSDVLAAPVEVTTQDFEDFYAAEFERVFNSAYALCRDREAAGEATQEAFSRAFARWRRLSRQDWAGAWVTTTALNVLRRRGRETRISIHDLAAMSGPDPAQRIDVLGALRSLPWRQQQAAVLFYIADLPVEAVAHAMGLSDGTVKAHLSRAREHLRKRLEDRDE